jgi:hypothetical protein
MPAERVFRTSTYVLVAVMVIASIAAENSVPDGAEWSDRFLAYSSAVAPWLVSAMIVWAAGEIVKAIRSGDD